MANTFNTLKNAPGVVAKAAAKTLHDELMFAKSVASADKEDYKGKNGYSAGDTIYISKPARYVPQNTFDITSSLQDTTEEKVPLVLNIISTIGLAIDSLEFATTFQLKSAMERIIQPAVQSIAQDAEAQFLKAATNAVYNTTGAAGANTFDVDSVLAGREKMSKFLCPKDKNRYFLHDSTAGRLAVGARKGLFQDSAEIRKQYKQGFVGVADGYNWMESELLISHTSGTATGTITVTNTIASQGVSTMDLTGTGAQTLTVGDRFTVGSVFAVHPITKKKYPFLQQFVVTALNTASGGAFSQVAVSPAMYSSATGLQNVDSLPQSGAAITLVNAASTTYTQNLQFHKNAFRKVSVPLIMPKAVEWAVQEEYQGVTVAIIRAFDVLKRRMVTRMDFLGGIVADRPEWANVITA